MYYNMIIREEYYSKKLPKILVLMIKKGKETMIGKMRLIEFIKIDLQVIMRIYLSNDKEETIDKDENFLKPITDVGKTIQ